MAKPKLLFYLKPEVLEIYNDQSEGSANFAFPPQLVRHQEIINPDLLTESLNKFLTELGISDLPIIILISKPLLYARQFAAGPTGVDRNLVEEFVETVPFENAQMAKLEFNALDSLLVLTTNRLLYQKIVEVAQSLGGKVEAVIPQTVFANLQTPVLSPSDVDQIFGDKKTLESANFLLSQETNTATKVVPPPKGEGDELEEEETEGKSKNKLLIIFGILFIIGGAIALGLMTKVIKNPWVKSDQVQNPPQIVQASASPKAIVATESAVLVSSQSAALQEIKKELLKIDIVNGSGISGQGSKVKTILTNLGYKDINIEGTTSISGNTDTLVNASSKMSAAAKTELVQELSKTFLNVKTNDASPSAKYDVVITTGTYK